MITFSYSCLAIFDFVGCCTVAGDPDLMADSECTPPPPKRKRIQLSQGIGRSAKGIHF